MQSLIRQKNVTDMVEIMHHVTMDQTIITTRRLKHHCWIFSFQQLRDTMDVTIEIIRGIITIMMITDITTQHLVFHSTCFQRQEEQLRRLFP